MKELLFNRLQRIAGRSKAAVWLSVKLKNQCERVIGYGFAQSNDHLINGEYFIASHLIKDGSVIFDVGANYGAWTASIISSGKSGLKFTLFEPAADAYNKLLERFQQKGDIVINNIGAGD